MSETVTEQVEVQEPVEAGELAPPQGEQAPQDQAAPAEDDLGSGVELKAGVTYVEKDKADKVRATLGGKIGTLEKRLKELEPAEQELTQLRQYVNDARPYIEFLKNNPDLLKPREAASQAPQTPAQDTEAIEYAREFDLYDKEGQLDTARARRIIDKTATLAKQAAQEAVRPFAEQTLEQRAATNIRAMQDLADADGNRLTIDTINQTAGVLMQSMSKDQVRQLFADPNSVNIIANIAFGVQARTKKSAPKAPAPPAHDPLELEQAGGGQGAVRFSEGSKRLFASMGIKEGTAEKAAKRFRPGENNSLED